MGFKNWETPPEFFAKMDAIYHFTLDAAASADNALCSKFYTEETDGISSSWVGERVWCNPPYDSSLYQWCKKASKFEAEVAVLLLPPSVDTSWFHEFIWKKPAVDVNFYRGRLKFWKEGKVGPAPRAGNLIAVFE